MSTCAEFDIKGTCKYKSYYMDHLAPKPVRKPVLECPAYHPISSSITRTFNRLTTRKFYMPFENLLSKVISSGNCKGEKHGGIYCQVH